ncbi:hypothetical protein ACFLR4_01630 [Bacteroidota bacterium]
MKRLIAIFFVLAFAFSNIIAQSEFTLQFNGGIVSPVNSQTGLSCGVQINYKLNNELDLYFLTGYSTWYKNRLLYESDTWPYKSVYDENNHRLIPFEFGTRYMFAENKLFKTFIEAEIGLCYLIYDKYEVLSRINIEGEEEFYVAGLEQNDTDQFLLGLGVGIGVMRNIGSNVNLILGGKIKTIVNSDYNDFELMENLYFLTYFGLGFNL